MKIFDNFKKQWNTMSKDKDFEGLGVFNSMFLLRNKYPLIFYAEYCFIILLFSVFHATVLGYNIIELLMFFIVSIMIFESAYMLWWRKFNG